MPPKRGNASFSKKQNGSFTNSNTSTSIVNLFKRIESNDSTTVKCQYCTLFIKSCLLKDHLDTKCQAKMKLKETERQKHVEEDSDDVVFIEEVGVNKKEKREKGCSVVKKEFRSSDSQSTPLKSILKENRNRLSIYVNGEEKAKYMKDEKVTPIKDEQYSPVSGAEKADCTLVLDGEESEPFIPSNLVLNCFSDYSEEITAEKLLPKVEDKKLLEMHDTLNTLETPSKKRLTARKSTSARKHNTSVKENHEEESKQLPNTTTSSSSSSSEDLLAKLEIERFDEAENENEAAKKLICYALQNFINALETVFDDKHFVYLLNDSDLHIINSFYQLSEQSKKLYVRLFQRKYKWIQAESVNYEYIAHDLMPYFNELKEKQFLRDESTIDTYDEIVDLLKLPQLKQLAKQFLVSLPQNSNRRIDYIKAILNQFKTQKKLNFTKDVTSQNEAANAKYMSYCRNLLGKSYKLNKGIRDVFVRVLMLYSLSSTHHMDQKNVDSGQQQLQQILMINLGKLKYMNYAICFDTQIYENRETFINYQNSLEYEFELIDMIEDKEFEKAYENFDKKLYFFKQSIKDLKTQEKDSKLPNYLRRFLANTIYCKILSIYSMEILQRMKFYKQANELFEFLLFEQGLYLLDSRYHWFERLAINYETHLKDPYRAMEILKLGLEDKQNVRKAGRVALYQRAQKMAQIKRYVKIDDLSEKLNLICEKEVYNIVEAPIKTIEANLLQPEIIPGRKTIFVQNSSQTANRSKNLEICSVEQIAMSHYTNNEEFTHGRHAETSSIMTIFGLLFWEILFDSNVMNVFVDRYQTAPLDLGTDHFYLNRKENIDKKIVQIKEGDSEYVHGQVTSTWEKHFGIQCSLVNWQLFENLDELKLLLNCFTNEKLASLCKYIAQNYRYCRSGGPDLMLWSVNSNNVKFVEVKGPGDKLSFKQIIWLDFFQSISIDCEVCYVKGTCSKRLRDTE